MTRRPGGSRLPALAHVRSRTNAARACLSIALATLAAAGMTAASAEASNPTFGQPTTPAMSVEAGRVPSFWFVPVLAGQDPVSTDLRVWMDLRPLGGPARGLFVDQHVVCEDDTHDDTFFACFVMPINALPGTRDLTMTVSDAQGRSSSRLVSVTVTPPAIPTATAGRTCRSSRPPRIRAARSRATSPKAR